jgi:hypothetical protein
VIISVEPAGTLGITQQLSNIDQLGKPSSLFLHYFYYFIYISTVAVSLPVSLQVTTSVSDPEWIRIQSGQRIRIQEGKNDAQK